MNDVTSGYLSLPVSKRIELVADIWDSIAEEAAAAVTLSADEVAELQRRVTAHQAEPSNSLPWPEVRETLLAQSRNQVRSGRGDVSSGCTLS